jgi:hypothetical protein
MLTLDMHMQARNDNNMSPVQDPHLCGLLLLQLLLLLLNAHALLHQPAVLPPLLSKLRLKALRSRRQLLQLLLQVSLLAQGLRLILLQVVQLPQVVVDAALTLQQGCTGDSNRNSRGTAAERVRQLRLTPRRL